VGKKLHYWKVLKEKEDYLKFSQAGLLKEFGDPRLAVAAYNAGATPVRQWWKARTTDDLEVFVELIPFTETRGFVRRVMLAWEEYRRLYGSAAGARP